MNATKFYAVSFVAVKIKSASGQPADVHIDVGVNSWAVLAKSNEEAMRRGVNIALERWPEEDGWVGHKASVAEISQGALSQALSIISGEDDEASGEIELIM